MSIQDLPPELLDHLSAFLDLRSSVNLSSTSRRFRRHFYSSSAYWKRVALEHYCLRDRGSLLYGTEDEGVEKYRKACNRYRDLRNNLRRGSHRAWRFNLDPSRDYLIPLSQGNENPRSYDPSLKARYDMDETLFSLDWNGDYAVMIVNYKNVSEIFVWKTRSPSPTFSYVAVKYDVQISCKNFAIFERFLVIIRSQSFSILSLYDMEEGLRFVGEAEDPALRKEVLSQGSGSSHSPPEEFVEVLNGGKIVTFSFRNPSSPVLYVINIYDLSILHKYSIDPGFTRDFTLLYHVEHRPTYRNGVALHFPSKHPINGMYEPIYDLSQNSFNRPSHFYLASIRADGIRLYPGGAISCFGMDITEDGHILALINRLDVEKPVGVGCVALYRRDSDARYDKMECVRNGEGGPAIMHDFRGGTPLVLKGSYLNRQVDDWTGDHQIRLCHERNLAVVMTNSLKKIVTFNYNRLASSNPEFNILYEIDYVEFSLNDDFNTLTLAVSRNALALADDATIVIRDIQTGKPLNVLKLPDHASASSASSSASEDDFGLGFLLINDSDILAHYFCPHVFPDAFDIFKFYP